MNYVGHARARDRHAARVTWRVYKPRLNPAQTPGDPRDLSNLPDKKRLLHAREINNFYIRSICGNDVRSIGSISSGKICSHQKARKKCCRIISWIKSKFSSQLKIHIENIVGFLSWLNYVGFDRLKICSCYLQDSFLVPSYATHLFVCFGLRGKKENSF